MATIQSIAPLILFILMVPSVLTLQEKFEIDPSQAESWLKESKETFDPASWEGFREFQSLEEFLKELQGTDEAYVLFYNREDNATYSTSPFFKTSSEILKESKPLLPTWTVDMVASPEISNYYGIPTTQTIVFYFYKKAPIVFKFDHMEKTKRPIDQWMKDVKMKADGVREVKDENDLDVFENSNNLIFMVVDKDKEHLAHMMAAVGFNYPELSFSYMLRSESTLQLEKDINEEYGFSDQTEGSRSFNLVKNL